MMVSSHFDLAIIDVGLPEISGVELATFAANENIPVLLISGHPEINNKLERFDYPYLAKPFGLDKLAAEAVRVIAATGENIRRVKASAEKMRANKEALSAAVAESQRLLQEIKTQHAARKLVSHPMQVPSAGWIDDLN
jgi:DNA-binding NtrC family response regulator